MPIIAVLRIRKTRIQIRRQGFAYSISDLVIFFSLKYHLQYNQIKFGFLSKTLHFGVVKN